MRRCQNVRLLPVSKRRYIGEHLKQHAAWICSLTIDDRSHQKQALTFLLTREQDNERLKNIDEWVQQCNHKDIGEMRLSDRLIGLGPRY